MRKYITGLFFLLLVPLQLPAVCAAAAEIDARTEVVNSGGKGIDYNKISGELSIIEKTLKSGNNEPSLISEYIGTLDGLRSQIVDGKKQIERDLQFVEKRIEALGPVPEDGSKEVEAIAKNRKTFNSEASQLRAKISEADILLAKIDEIDVLILTTRNQALLGHLLERQEPLVYPQNLFTANKLFVSFVIDIIKSPLKWYDNLSKADREYVKDNIFPVSAIVLLALFIGIYLRRFIMRHFGYKRERDPDERLRYSSKVSAAFFVALAYGVIPASLIFAALIWMYSTKVLTIGFFGMVLNSFLYYSLYVIIGRAFARVTLAPYNEKWRLVNVSTEKAKKLTSVLYFFITMIGLCAFLEFIAVKASYSPELMYFIMTISSAVKALSIIMIVKTILWDDVAIDDEEENEDNSPVLDDEEAMSPPMKITFLVSFFSIGVFLLSLFGYPRLSSFIFNRFIASCLIIGIFVILRKSVTEILHRILFLRFWAKTFKLRRRLISKIDFWLTLIVDPLFIIVALLILLSTWGVSTDLLLLSAKKLLFGFSVGGVEISLISIFFGILVFVMTLGLTKAVRRRIINNVLNKMDIDDGIKHSLASGFGFIGFVIAIMLAIAVMGGNLSNLAIIAGALSVGIGLGLQNVVNNFVSGIILLFERPIKVGDWVKINGEEGKIKQINIRATEVETFNRSSVIIPNASLLSNDVTNLTHGNNWARYSVKIGVAYGSDVEKVRDILLECANGHKRVLKKPEPYVLFQDFGSSSLDFELRFYVSDIWSGWSAPSDIRFEINRRFKEEGIEIPFPQMVVHHGSEVSEATEGQFYAAKKKAKANAAEKSE